MHKRLLTTTAAALLIGGTAAAQTAEPRPYTEEPGGFYLGGGYTFIDIETDSDIGAFDDQGDSTNAFTARAGYQITPVFSVEIDGTFGFDDGNFDLDSDEIDFSDLDTDTFDDEIDTDNLDSALANGGDVGLDYLFGLYGRVSLPVNEQLHLSGRVGYAFAEIDVTNSATITTIDPATNIATTVTTSRSAGGSDDGFAFGASARYDLTESGGVRLDYTRYNFGEANADAVTLSWQQSFGGPAAGY